MKTATEAPANPVEHAMDYWRRSAQWSLELQEEVFDHWSKLWSGTAPAPQDWTKRLGKFQKDWSNTVTDIMNKHRAMFDKQYRAGIDTLEESFKMASSKDPEEFRERCAAMCRKTLDVMKETSESQAQQLEEASNKWIELWRTSP